MKKLKSSWVVVIILAAALVIGQVMSYFVAPNSWNAFFVRLPVIISMIAFWGPIVTIIASVFVWIVMRLMGFNTLEEIRAESVEQNNPTPAILFVGTMIASVLFLLLVIKP